MGRRNEKATVMMPRKRRIRQSVVIVFICLAIWLILPLFVVRLVRSEDRIPYHIAAPIVRCAVAFSVKNPLVEKSAARYFANHGRVFNENGVAFTNTGKYQSALAEFDHSVSCYRDAAKCDASYQAVVDRTSDNCAVMLLHWSDDLIYDDNTTEGKRVLEMAVRKFPQNALVYVKYADLLNSEDHLSQAESYYAKAQGMESSDVVLGYAMNQMLNIRDEIEISTRLEYKSYQDLQNGFVVKVPEYEGAVSTETLLEYFVNAKERCKSVLGLDTSRPLHIRIYHPADFAKVSDAPSWAEAAFDVRLRMNLDRIGEGIKAAEDLVYHEYTHAIIERKLKTKVPVWFQEGIAQLMEPNTSYNRDELKSLCGTLTTATLGALSENSFADIDSRKEAETAYILSKYFVWQLLCGETETTNSLTDNGRRLIELLKTGGKFDDVFRKCYEEELNTAYSDWKLSICK